VATTEGVGTTARVLGVDRDRLARRVSEQKSRGPGPHRAVSTSASSSVAFVELSKPQSLFVNQCVVRLLGADGEQLEIVGDTDVLALVREFWNRRR